jgi:hypothetical protein
MNSYSLSKLVLRQISETVCDLPARETANLSRECSRLALQNIANSDFDLGHFYFAMAKELMIIAVRQKKESAKTVNLVSAAAN